VLPVKDSTPVESEPGKIEYYALSQLYLMAEMLMDNETKDVVLAAILARSQEPYTDGKLYFPGVACLKALYNGTREGSPVRQLLVRFYTDNNVDKLCDTKPEDIPQDFLHEVSLSLLAHRPLLKDHTVVKKNLARKEKGYKKQIATKDQTIKDLQTQKKAIQAERDVLLTQLKAGQAKRASETLCLRPRWLGHEGIIERHEISHAKVTTRDDHPYRTCDFCEMDDYDSVACLFSNQAVKNLRMPRYTSVSVALGHSAATS
jgi:hypothetical protein